MATLRPGRRRRGLWALGALLLGAAFALYIGLPVAMAVAALWPAGSPVGPPPAGFRDQTLRTGDGVDLAAWYAPSRNGAAILVLHGAGDSREAMRSQAEMLRERGYGVLALDLRGHGESGGRTNRLGWEGSQDLEAGLRFLQGQSGVHAIGALGSSMGAEVLLGASSELPEIGAIVADGATRRSTGELLALPAERPLVRSFTARLMYGTVGLLAGSEPQPPLLDAMRKARSTEFLLIAAGEEDLEQAYNTLFAEALGGRARLWTVPGVPHTGAFAAHPAEYEGRVVGFFEEHLLNGDG